MSSHSSHKHTHIHDQNSLEAVPLNILELLSSLTEDVDDDVEDTSLDFNFAITF